MTSRIKLKILSHLQLIQNSAARLVTATVTHPYWLLHWLFVSQYKVLINALHGEILQQIGH